MKIIEIKPYLTEKKLAEIAKEIFPNVETQKRFDLDYGRAYVDIYFKDDLGEYIFEYSNISKTS